MATGIDWEHPEVRKGLELFEELFRDRLYPPEVPEEVPEATPPRREVPFVPDPSPMKIPTPPAKWWTYKVDAPKWLTHSMDRDLFPEQTHPDWYRRFWDKTYPQSPIKPPYPPSPGESPPFWDISDILELESPDDKSDVFMTPGTPSSPPPEQLEQPLPDFPDDPAETSYEKALHEMHWELQKYKYDKEHVVGFVKMAPLVRDTQILTKELEALVKLYIPDVDAENMGPLVAHKALEDYIKMTEEKIEERYGDGDPYTYKYPEITEEVLAAQVRLHKQKALDAIDTYRRGYFFLLKEVEKAEAEVERLKLENEKQNAVSNQLSEEVKRLRAEEHAADKEYQENQMRRHTENCPLKAEFETAFQRNIELQRLIPRVKKELEITRESHEREVKNMANWVTLFPPKFAERLQWLLSGSLTESGYKPVPVERYMEFIADMETDIQTVKGSREGDLHSVSKECNALADLVNAEIAKMEEMKRITNDLLEKQSVLSEELYNIRLESQNRWDLWAQLREEHIYYREYNEMLLGKIIALRAEASVESEDLLAITGPKSRSPSPAPAEPSPASPPAFGSETFNISQIESSPRFDESPDLLAEERPPSEMLDLSDLSGSGGTPEHDLHDSLDEDRPPSEMLNISDLSGSGGSPGHESMPQGQDQSDNLDEERPPSGMVDFSDLSGSGGSPEPESTPPGQDQDQSDNLDGEGPPSGELDFSGLQGGASFLDSPEDSESSGKKTVVIPSPGKMEQVRMDVEIIPQDIRRSPSGQRVVCDVAVQMQEAALRPPRGIEKRYKVVRGSPPISQTVGRRVDRRHGMFTPSSAIRRGYVGVRRPLFAGDFESPESPFGTGRRTHPELMNLPERAPSPRPPNLDTTMEWENPELNTAFRK